MLLAFISICARHSSPCWRRRPPLPTVLKPARAYRERKVNVAALFKPLQRSGVAYVNAWKTAVPYLGISSPLLCSCGTTPSSPSRRRRVHSRLRFTAPRNNLPCLCSLSLVTQANWLEGRASVGLATAYTTWDGTIEQTICGGKRRVTETTVTLVMHAALARIACCAFSRAGAFWSFHLAACFLAQW